MIGALSGTIDLVGDDSLLIDVSGVGYEVFVSNRTLAQLGESGEKTKLLIYTDVKENSIQLYGFQTSLEKQVFLLLRKVKGIGAKIALSTLSTLSAEEVLVSIGREDVSGLRKVPGVGAKTAERVIVELREAVKELGMTVEHSPRGRVQTVSDPSISLSSKNLGGAADDVVLALERLGFGSERAKEVVSLTVERLADSKGLSTQNALKGMESGDLLRMALSNIQ